MLQTLIVDNKKIIIDKFRSPNGSYITSGLIYIDNDNDNDNKTISFYTINRQYEVPQVITTKQYEGNLEHPTRKVKSNALYVNKREMMEEILQYQQTKEVSEKLAHMFRLIAKKFSSHSWFFRYTYREDMISQAVMMMLKKVDKFNINYPNADPFNYFSSIAYNEFRQMIKKENKTQLARENLRQYIWVDICTDENLEYNDDSTQLNNYMKDNDDISSD